MIYITTYPLTQRINPMRKLLLATAAVASAIGLAVAGEPSFGTFTDARDGQTYKTVKIGEQTWMAQDLNYKMDSSWCYDNKESNCKKYGRLYTWDAAMMACPNGLMLPDSADWNRLVATTGGRFTAGKILKAKNGWKEHRISGNGTDDYGFSAMPNGGRSSDGNFYSAGTFGNWWTATEYYNNSAYYIFMRYHTDYVGMNKGWVMGKNNKGYAFSVRCVADRP
jgi:uncharacterized protein (TIGR02145 family)